jgi:hypothetical protein
MDIERFKEENKDKLEEMENVLSISKVRYITVSSEMVHYLDGMLEGKVILINHYMASNRIDIVMKSDSVYPIRFFIPCICGIYPNEKHP